MITKWVLAHNTEIGWHRHSYDYIVVPLSDRQLNIETAKGKNNAMLKEADNILARKALRITQ